MIPISKFLEHKKKLIKEYKILKNVTVIYLQINKLGNTIFRLDNVFLFIRYRIKQKPRLYKGERTLNAIFGKSKNNWRPNRDSLGQVGASLDLLTLSRNPLPSRYVGVVLFSYLVTPSLISFV